MDMKNVAPLDEIMAIASLSDGNLGAATAMMDMRKAAPREAWPMCMMTMMALDIRGTELYLLYNDVCNRDALALARYLYAIRTGAAPLHRVRRGLHALHHGEEVCPVLQLRPIVGRPAPWMESHIATGRKLFGPDWQWEGL